MVNNFDARYKKLNALQRQAVDKIDGPLLVLAGPGTGKTELLSVRAANILSKTDTLPENILCLTFTESGTINMQKRLESIAGPAARKVAVYTFHGFASEIMNSNNSYFYHGSDYQIADEITSHEVLSVIFDELDYDNPLSTKLNGGYVYLKEVSRVISELKRSGLTSEELLKVISANESIIDEVEKDLSAIFSEKISIKMTTALSRVAQRVASAPPLDLPPAITPLSNILALSLARTVDEADETGKTNSLTAWRNHWMEKDIAGNFIFKDRKRNQKLRAAATIYFMYITRMAEAGLYDYDDMILDIVHAMETQPDLKYNLQEKYQYIMIDEFQDTNLAQLRIIFNLTDNPVNEGNPNIMAVGDDDQAIYSFQGADVNNIKRFQNEYPSSDLIVLRDNYRSAAKILEASREIITQNTDRLETITTGLDKSLDPHHDGDFSVNLTEYPTLVSERAGIAEKVNNLIKNGEKPENIAVLARKHREIIELLPYFNQYQIKVNYEKQDDVLENEVVRLIELIARIVLSLGNSAFDKADSLLPELLAQPCFGFDAESVWRLSLKAYRDRITWVEAMMVSNEFKALAEWLITMSKDAHLQSLESMVDQILGSDNSTDAELFRSPIYTYYFSPEASDTNPESYLTMLESLRTLRDALREYQPNQAPNLVSLITFIDTHRQIGIGLKRVVHASDKIAGAVNLMTSHKAKGLEFEHVFIHGASDNIWGEKARSRSRLISYPDNLQLASAGDNLDERIRLFFVSMTRAKSHLYMSFSQTNELGRTLLPASFLGGVSIEKDISESPEPSIATEELEIDWHGRLTASPTQSMKDLLTPKLETYKLSATHLNSFIDIVGSGPNVFLSNSLLRFPTAKTPSAAYGTAIHTTLQRAHNHMIQYGKMKPLEDLLADFAKELKSQRLSDSDFAAYLKKGNDSLSAYVRQMSDTFRTNQKTELSFAGQNVTLGDAKLTGSLDLVDFENKSIFVTDYKTGRPSRDWKGRTEFEKIKLHKYRQQLMFYELLARNSRDYSGLKFEGARLQFVEPDNDGQILSLETTFTDEELEEFSKLIQAIWDCIQRLEFPDISAYPQSLKGIIAFEQNLVDNL